MRQVPLLVLSAGVEGLAAAVALAHQGFPVHVLDRGPDPAAGDPAGAAVTLMPEACRELSGLGLLERLRDTGREPTRMVHLDAVTGRPLRDVVLGSVVRERFGFPVLCTPPGELRRALAEACAADDMVTAEYGVCPTTVDDVVDAALVSDAEGPTHRAEALVAADGTDSRVRSLLGDGEPLGPPFMVHTAPATPLAGEPVLRVFSSPVLHAGAGPAGGIRIVVRPGTGPDDLRRALENHLPELRDAVGRALDETSPVLVGHHRPLARWTRHRIAVLGDAAHPLLPHGAQATSQTLVDAVTLGRAFDQCDGRVLESLESYARLRAPVRLRAAGAAAEFAGLCHAEGLTRRLRDQLWAGGPSDPLAELVGAA